MLTESNPKLIKGQRLGYLSFGLTLAPATSSGYEMCEGRSPGCTTNCLRFAGRGRMDPVQQARVRKTRALIEEPFAFKRDLRDAIRAAVRRAQRMSLIPCFRLNVLSDWRWEGWRPDGTTILEDFEYETFYDYTALADRNPTDNYYLTYSRKESNDAACRIALSRGINVAAVFDERPGEWLGYPVIDGDAHDLRFLDPRPVIVGLSPKGRARDDRSGFVIRLQEA